MVSSLELMSSYRAVAESVCRLLVLSQNIQECRSLIGVACHDSFYPFFWPVFLLKIGVCFSLISISKTLSQGSQQGSPDKRVRKGRNGSGAQRASTQTCLSVPFLPPFPSLYFPPLLRFLLLTLPRLYHSNLALFSIHCHTLRISALSLCKL